LVLIRLWCVSDRPNWNREVARQNKTTHPNDSAVGISTPAKRIDKIARLLSDIADLMRQEDLGKESLHHLRQLQMRIRFAQGQSLNVPLVSQDLPLQPPALWRDRTDKNESPVDFIRREYGRWLGIGLTRAHLRADMSLYDSLKHWLRENDLPDDLDLPTKSAMVDRELADAKSTSIVHSPEQKQRLRLREAARRRASKSKQQ
jgi:hypothetical protein